MRPFIFIRFLTTLSSILFCAQLSSAQQRNPMDVLQQMPSRQANALTEIAGEIEAGTVEQAAALFFLEADIEQANAGMQAYRGAGTTLPEISYLLRLLRTHETLESPVLNTLTQTHLHEQIKQILNQGGALFVNPMDAPLAYESQQFLSLSNLYMWAAYVESASVEYAWPDKKSHQEKQHELLNQINQWLNEKIRFGPGERSSPYYSLYLAGLMNVRESRRVDRFAAA